MIDSSLTNGNCVRINLRIDAIDTRLYETIMVTLMLVLAKLLVSAVPALTLELTV